MNLISHVDPMFFVGCKFEKNKQKISGHVCQKGVGMKQTKGGNIQVKVLVPWLESFVSTGFECHT